MGAPTSTENAATKPLDAYLMENRSGRDQIAQLVGRARFSLLERKPASTGLTKDELIFTA